MTVWAAASLVSSPSPQDQASRPSASIHVIVIDVATEKPIPRVELTVTTLFHGESQQNAITGESGDALLAGVTDGRVCVSAARQGYESIACNWGDSLAPTVLTLKRDEYRDHFVVRMTPAASISGRVVDEMGDPVVNLEVTAFRRRWGAAGPDFVPAGSAVTDDAGRYRLTALGFGAYVVGFVPRYETPSSVAPARDGTAPAAPTGTADGPVEFEAGGHRIIASNAGSPMPPPSRSGQSIIGYGPTYAPGATGSDATVISLAKGEFRNDVDIRLRPTGLAILTGLIDASSGDSIQAGQLTLARTPSAERSVLREGYAARVDSGGRFVIPLILPGTYRVVGRLAAASKGEPSAGVAAASKLFVDSPITVDAGSSQAVVLHAAPGSAVVGRVVVASGPSAGSNFRGFPITMLATEAGLSWTQQVVTKPDGRFTLEDLAPGTYRIVIGGLPGTGLLSVVADGRESLDGSLRIEAGVDVTDLVLTLSDRMPSVSGRVNSGGAPVDRSTWVVVFSSDRNAWTPQSRRVIAQHPSDAGAFEFRSLPPGRYFVVHAAIEQDSWRAASTLETLALAATPIALGLGDHQTMVLKK